MLPLQPAVFTLSLFNSSTIFHFPRNLPISFALDTSEGRARERFMRKAGPNETNTTSNRL